MCKYVSDPVLLERDDVGPVKFDLRFVVMVTSVCPLQLAVHEKFIVRVANKSVSIIMFLQKNPSIGRLACVEPFYWRLNKRSK